MLRKFNDLLKKYEDKNNIPKSEIEEFRKDMETMIKQEGQYSKLYLHSAPEYVDVE